WPADASAETVMIPDGKSVDHRRASPERRTACVSSQVGCPVGCRFCASGMNGVKSSLSTAQIIEQLMALNQILGARGERVTHVVFMGMGEPLANYNNVMRAVRIMHDPRALDISARKITISTVGVPPRIRQLADEDLPLNLALSLHAPNEPLRKQLIPWAEHFELDDILDACRHYFDRTGREITLEYILLADVNDRPEHARQLAKLCRTMRANVNLLRYNEVEGTPYKRPTAEASLAFQKLLRDAGINAHLRRSRGRDIDAACGQLRRKEERKLELFVVIAILAILLAIFVPYAQSWREASRRVQCADNLRQIRAALWAYGDQYGKVTSTERWFPRVRYDEASLPEGYRAYTGADDEDPFAPDSTVLPNDVTASLW
ncbi:MAG TPA: 23S rRNA (adenine(2503)-C(2))-methyltransferase RlmN, partial [Tepidisphaeraceae bacterium]|nr:23S rRNA (adenine(2503)-C(2))-methyltransferase RlmN [Tepidisphaeraceae bacterium]